DNEWQQVEMDFTLADVYAYSGTEHTLQLGLLQASTGEGGLVLPATLPWELNRTTSERIGIINIDGYTPTHLKVEIHGPTTGDVLSNIKVTAPGFLVELDTEVGLNETV